MLIKLLYHQYDYLNEDKYQFTIIIQQKILFKTKRVGFAQVSDLKGWNCAAAQIYGVRAIPATVLIKDGKIVARNLRGESLSRKLGELLDSGAQTPQ